MTPEQKKALDDAAEERAKTLEPLPVKPEEEKALDEKEQENG